MKVLDYAEMKLAMCSYTNVLEHGVSQEKSGTLRRVHRRSLSSLLSTMHQFFIFSQEDETKRISGIVDC